VNNHGYLTGIEINRVNFSLHPLPVATDGMGAPPWFCVHVADLQSSPYVPMCRFRRCSCAISEPLQSNGSRNLPVHRALHMLASSQYAALRLQLRLSVTLSLP